MTMRIKGNPLTTRAHQIPEKFHRNLSIAMQSHSNKTYPGRVGEERDLNKVVVQIFAKTESKSIIKVSRGGYIENWSSSRGHKYPFKRDHDIDRSRADQEWGIFIVLARRIEMPRKYTVELK